MDRLQSKQQQEYLFMQFGYLSCNNTWPVSHHINETKQIIHIWHKVCTHYFNIKLWTKLLIQWLMNFFSRINYYWFTIQIYHIYVREIATGGDVILLWFTGFHWPFCIKIICRSCNNMLVWTPRLPWIHQMTKQRKKEIDEFHEEEHRIFA
jgi:hypothetical protein